jgi:hypothetical protein
VVEADIQVALKRIERTETRRCRPVNNTPTCWPDVDTNTTRPNETVTVSDSVDVEVYDLTAYQHYAEYPNGDVGVAIFQSRPWQGYTLGNEDRDRVRGVWRFYTARDTNWDTLTRATATEDTEVESEALPVYVHAYPSEIGPRAELETGPEIIEVWGFDNPSPEATIDSNVHVDVVSRQYTRSYGIAIRHDTVDRDALTVYGIVRGATAELVEPPDGSTRQLRESNLTVTVIEQTQSHATLRIELRDNETDNPIALELPERWRSITGESPRRGYIEIAEQRVRTNLSGVAIVTVNDPGFYTARYRPESWLGNNPAYIEDSTSTRWHPLTTLDGWWQLLVDFLWLLIPFVAMWYVSRQLLLMFWPDQYFER